MPSHVAERPWLYRWLLIALPLALISPWLRETHPPQAAHTTLSSGVDPGVCIDTSVYASGTWAKQGHWDVTLSGNLALVPRLRGGLDVHDISIPGAPVFKDNFPSAGNVLDVEVSGSYAYLAEWDFGDANRGVTVVSLANLSNIQQVGGNTLPVNPYDVEIQDSLLFVADGTVPGTLWIMSLANPVAPSVIGTYATPHHVRSVFVVDTLAYLALAPDGIAIVDVSNPALPVLVGSLPVLTSAYDIYVVDTVAYVANVSYGLALVDVSDPTAPTLLGTYNTAGSANDVEVVDGYAHVADIDGGYVILDVSDPLHPSLVEAVPSVDRMLGLTVRSPYTFGADDTAFTVFVFQGQGLCGDAQVGPCEECDDGNQTRGDGCSDCDVDRAVEVCDMGIATIWPLRARGAVLRDSLLFVAMDTAGLAVFNVRYGGPPVRVSTLNTAGEARRVSLAGNLAAVACGTGGLALVDISDPAHLAPLGVYPTPLLARDVELVDSLAYLATAGTLHVVNVADPDLPVSLGTLGGIGSGNGIEVVGPRAYVAGGTLGVLVLDISNPAAPSVLGSRVLASEAWDVDAKGDTVYVATSSTGVATIDASHATSPEMIGQVGGGRVYQAVRQGAFLYLAHDTAKLTVYPVSPLDFPPRVATFPAFDYVRWLAVAPGLVSCDIGGANVQVYAQSVLGEHWCGNGLLEPGEGCDDSNYVGDDGCTPCCQLPPPAAVCANGNVETGEECDDGNSVAGDGCSPSCQLEPTVCGNGIREYDEECDDGNTDPSDGCDGCRVEPVCGNSVIEFGEECDDGNADPYDGCDGCQLGPVCGDGVVAAPEECDDGNRTPGDGCDASCQYEHTCGDGNLELGEECDDGNLIPLDGCSADCRIESCLITLPGDGNLSGTRTSADIILLVGYCFKGGMSPHPCAANGDVNCDDVVTSGDIIYMVNHIFKGGPPPCDICHESLLATSCT